MRSKKILGGMGSNYYFFFSSKNKSSIWEKLKLSTNADSSTKIIFFVCFNFFFEKVTFNFTLFSKFLKKWLKFVIFDKTFSGGKKRDDIIKKINQSSHWQDTRGKKCFYYFYQNLFFLVVLTCWKRNTFQNSMKFH